MASLESLALNGNKRLLRTGWLASTLALAISLGLGLTKAPTASADTAACTTNNSCTPVLFANAILSYPGVNAPITNANQYALQIWQGAEGGGAGCPGQPAKAVPWPYSRGPAGNPLNTTQPEPGSTDWNSVHVKIYADTNAGAGQTCWYWGIKANGDTLTNGFYPNIISALQNPSTDPGTQCVSLAQAVGNSPWGTGNFQADCGGPVPGSPTTEGIALRTNGTSGYILNGYGNLKAFGGALTISSGFVVGSDLARGLVLCPDGASGYILDAYGGIHQFGQAPYLPTTGYHSGVDLGRGIILRPDNGSSCGQGGYWLDYAGGLHPYGNNLGTPLQDPGAPLPPGVQTHGLVSLTNGLSGYWADGWGGVHPWASSGTPLPPNVTVRDYFPGQDVVRSMVFTGEGSNTNFPLNSGYMLDLFGGFHPYNGAPQASGSAYWPGQDRARGLAFSAAMNRGVYTDGFGAVQQFSADVGPLRSIALRSSDSTTGYVLSSYGNLKAFGGAPTVSSGFVVGSDLARGLVLCPDGVSGYILDAYGGIHQFGQAPYLPTTGYHSGVDLGRGIILRPDNGSSCGQGGYWLDYAGGLHPYGNNLGLPLQDPGAPLPSSLQARGLVSLTNGLSGYWTDGSGNVHPWASSGTSLPPNVTVRDHFPGQDIMRGIVFSGDGSNPNFPLNSGYVLDYFGGFHPYNGAPQASGSAYWPNQDIARGMAIAPSYTGGMYISSGGVIANFTT